MYRGYYRLTLSSFLHCCSNLGAQCVLFVENSVFSFFHQNYAMCVYTMCDGRGRRRSTRLGLFLHCLKIHNLCLFYISWPAYLSQEWKIYPYWMIEYIIILFSQVWDLGRRWEDRGAAPAPPRQYSRPHKYSRGMQVILAEELGSILSPKCPKTTNYRHTVLKNHIILLFFSWHPYQCAQIGPSSGGARCDWLPAKLWLMGVADPNTGT